MVEGSGRLQMQAPELLHNPVLQRSSSHSKKYTACTFSVLARHKPPCACSQATAGHRVAVEGLYVTILKASASPFAGHGFAALHRPPRSSVSEPILGRFWG
ncbi:hypothetical protein ACSQ67_022879 [Phaseolus vulgaris]